MIIHLSIFPAYTRVQGDDTAPQMNDETAHGDRYTQGDDQQRSLFKIVLSSWRQLISSKEAMASLLFAIILFSGIACVLANYGVWLQEQHGLSVEAVGFSAAVIGAGELTGELLVVAFSDRLGLLHATGVGIFMLIASSLTLAFLGNVSVFVGLACMFWFFASVEFCAVSFLPYVGTILPCVPTTVNGAVSGSIGLGIFVGIQYAERIWKHGRILWIGCASAAQFGVASLIWVFLWYSRPASVRSSPQSRAKANEDLWKSMRTIQSIARTPRVTSLDSGSMWSIGRAFRKYDSAPVLPDMEQ